jgi:hypothetical protein
MTPLTIAEGVHAHHSFSPHPAVSIRSARTGGPVQTHPAGGPVQVVTAPNAPTLCLQCDLAPPRRSEVVVDVNASTLLSRPPG